MALVQIWVEVPDELLDRLRAVEDGEEVPDDLCEEAEYAVIDSIQTSFAPMDLV